MCRRTNATGHPTRPRHGKLFKHNWQREHHSLHLIWTAFYCSPTSYFCYNTCSLPKCIDLVSDQVSRSNFLYTMLTTQTRHLWKVRGREADRKTQGKHSRLWRFENAVPAKKFLLWREEQQTQQKDFVIFTSDYQWFVPLLFNPY
jgi:hypothetical protein